MQENKNIQEEIDLRKCVYLVISKWYWVALGVVVGAIVGFILYKTITPKYTVRATIMMRMSDKDDVGTLSSSESKSVKDNLEVFRSRDIMGMIIDSLGILTECEQKEGGRWVGKFGRTLPLRLRYAQPPTELRSPINVEVKANGSEYKIALSCEYGSESFTVKDFSQPLETLLGKIYFEPLLPLHDGDKLRFTTYDKQKRISYYLQQIDVAQIALNSNVLNIALESTNPEMGAAIIQKMIDLYNETTLEDTRAVLAQTALFVNDRLAVVTEELSAIEKDIERYKTENSITDLTEEAKTFLEMSQTYQQGLLEVTTQLNVVDFIFSSLNDTLVARDITIPSVGITDEGLVLMIDEYNKLVLQKQKVEQNARGDNPVLENINAQLAAFHKNILQSIKDIRASLGISKANLEQKERVLATRLASLPTYEKECLEKERQRKIKQDLYILLMQRNEELSIKIHSELVPMRIIDSPQADPESKNPRGLFFMAVSVLIGAIVPIIILLGIYFVRHEWTSLKDYEREVQL